MSVTAQLPITGSTSTPVPTNASGTAITDKTDSKTQFLKLLVTQLQNQDPLDPTDQKEMLAQLAQFSSLEQMQNLNSTLTSSSQLQQLGQGSSLIGKTVTTTTDKGEVGPSGVVTSVVMKSGVAYLHIGSDDVEMSTVSTVK
ncbi:MAG: flagellar hook capping FlgD N-terminal domain-containing protein [Capsulimonas sp.]|uniref:flagellar hook assembly protein FlgD n=1 Tax=Capsulimonas sp. TaxID=2494211 RepID=UPI0032669BC3